MLLCVYDYFLYTQNLSRCFDIWGAYFLFSDAWPGVIIVGVGVVVGGGSGGGGRRQEAHIVYPVSKVWFPTCYVYPTWEYPVLAHKYIDK